jgi:hypothetical protein
MLQKIIPTLAALGLSAGVLLARQLKEFDDDVNYDEARVPHYDLPDPLVTAEGKLVTTAGQWRNVRRPQILSLFANFVYGAVPVPPDPIVQTYRVVREDKSFMGGKATKLNVAIRFKNRKGTAETLVLVFLPNKAKGPVPAFMMLSFDDPRGGSFKASTRREGFLNNGVPLGQLLDSGYAYVSVYHGDLVGHNETSFGRGIHKLFFRDGQSMPKAHEWGVLTVNGWTGMRAQRRRMSGSRWRSRRSPAAAERRCGAGSTARRWPSSTASRTGSASTRASSTSAKTICRWISTCCSR